MPHSIATLQNVFCACIRRFTVTTLKTAAAAVSELMEMFAAVLELQVFIELEMSHLCKC